MSAAAGSLAGVRALAARAVFGVALFLLVVAGGTGVGKAVAGQSATAATPDSAAQAADTTAASRRVIAYYFHTTLRCSSCRKIETYSREAIHAAFPGEIESGRLVWRVVNIEEKGNEHFVKDYQLYTKSLVLVEERNGQRARWRNAAKIWELLGDKERFFAYVQGETRAFLVDQP